MQYQFKGQEDIFVLEKSQMSEVLEDGRLVHKGKIAHVAKVSDTWWIHYDGHTFQLEIVEPGSSGQNDEANLTAPMPGKVLEVFVKQGDEVTEGQTLMILEAMKMEHKIVANHDGTVTSLNFSAGDQVEQGNELLEISSE